MVIFFFLMVISPQQNLSQNLSQRPPNPTSSFVLFVCTYRTPACMHVCGCAYGCSSTCVLMYVEAQNWCQVPSPIFSILAAGSLAEPGSHQFWVVSSAFLPQRCPLSASQGSDYRQLPHSLAPSRVPETQYLALMFARQGF